VKKSVLGVATAVAVATASVLVAAPASANDHGGSPPTAGAPETIAEGLVTPLSLEIDRQRVAYISQNFAPNAEGIPAGRLTRVARDGTVSVLAEAPPGQEISAVSSRDGYVYYAQLDGEAHSFGSMVRIPEGGGTPEPFADLYAHEAEENPDGDAGYGFQGLTDDCVAQFPPSTPMSGLPAESGIVDIHPYASLALNNAIFVADAGANAITRVGYDGTVSTVAVLPPQAPVQLTVEQLAAYEYPACAAGADWITEPVPTDIEIGPDGWLYVTTLPGGPEDPSLGARGSVYKVNQKTGEVQLVATGFTGATGLAAATDGTIYVTEIFGGADGSGQISVLEKGATEPEVLLAVPNPAAIEIRSNRLFVTWNVFAAGTLSLIEVDD
jgi:hypothetical protein